jgi:hypothetical protein
MEIITNIIALLGFFALVYVASFLIETAKWHVALRLKNKLEKELDEKIKELQEELQGCAPDPSELKD